MLDTLLQADGTGESQVLGDVSMTVGKLSFSSFMPVYMAGEQVPIREENTYIWQ